MSDLTHKDATNFPKPGGTAAGAELIGSALARPAKPRPDLVLEQLNSPPFSLDDVGKLFVPADTPTKLPTPEDVY